MMGGLVCRATIQHDYERRLQPRRAVCYTCHWRGPWVKYVNTAERHRQAHLYVGAHRA